MTTTTIMRRMRLLWAVGLVGLVGCSDDAESGGGKQRVRVTATAYAGQYSPLDEAGTRAGEWYEDYTGFLPYEKISTEFENQKDLTGKSIGAFFTKDGETPMAGLLHNENGKWQMTIDAESNEKYYVYGYIPDTGDFTASIAPNGTYAGGAVLTLSGLPTVTANDYCVTVGVHKGDDQETVSDSRDDNDALAVGKFIYRVEDTSRDDDKNHMFMLFDHLYAALKLQFKVDANYDLLRKIKLKKIEMMAENESQRRATCVVTLTANNTGANPITSVVFTADAGGDPSSEVIYSDADGVFLSSIQATKFFGGFLPQFSNGAVINKFRLITTYDVYDQKTGSIVRKGCTAENAINLAYVTATSGDFGGFERGKIRTLTLTVNPTYLYVLSEPDLDNPTLKIE